MILVLFHAMSSQGGKSVGASGCWLSVGSGRLSRGGCQGAVDGAEVRYRGGRLEADKLWASLIEEVGLSVLQEANTEIIPDDP